MEGKAQKLEALEKERAVEPKAAMFFDGKQKANVMCNPRPFPGLLVHFRLSSLQDTSSSSGSSSEEGDVVLSQEELVREHEAKMEDMKVPR